MIGPVQVLVVGFDRPTFSGEALAELTRLEDAGIVRLVDLLLVSRNAMSVRFHATDAQLRPMGRGTSGVTGMKFRDGDSLLSMQVIPDGTDPDVFVVFENGVAKRTAASEWTAKGRGTLGAWE